MAEPVTSVAQVRERVAEHPDILRRYGIGGIAVFGSVARGQASAESDVDLLVTFDKPLGAFSVIRLEHELEVVLGRRVEIVTRAALKPYLRDRIVAEAVDAA